MASEGRNSATREQLNGQVPQNSTLHLFELPPPQLRLDFRICVQLEPRISVGNGCWGHRNWISFRGGHFSATWGHGTVQPGGQDSQLVTQDLSTRVDTQYLLATADQAPAYIVVKTQGWRTGDREVMERLFDPVLADDVRPAEYSFKLFISLETGDERYKFLNTGMWLGTAARRNAEVLYDAYKLV